MNSYMAFVEHKNTEISYKSRNSENGQCHSEHHVRICSYAEVLCPCSRHDWDCPVAHTSSAQASSIRAPLTLQLVLTNDMIMHCLVWKDAVPQ